MAEPETKTGNAAPTKNNVMKARGIVMMTLSVKETWSVDIIIVDHLFFGTLPIVVKKKVINYDIYIYTGIGC